MTDSFEEKTTKAHQDSKSFKDEILEEMQQARQAREQRRLELMAQEEAARKEAELAAQRAEEARLEAERQAKLAEELAARQAEEARKKAELEAELAELARQEEEAERRRLEEARLAEEARQVAEAERRRREEEEAARRAEEARLAEEARQAAEAERRRREEEEAARQAEEARLAELARREAEARELARLEAARQERLAEEARLEQETRRLAELEELRLAELARIEAEEQELLRRQAELEALRHQELARREAEAEELARLEAEREARLAKEALYEEELETARRELERDDSLSQTAIPDQSDNQDLELGDITLLQADLVTPELAVASPSPMDLEAHFEPEQLEADGPDLTLEPFEEEDVLVAAPAIDKKKATSRLALKLSLVLATIILLMLLLTGFFVWRYIDDGIKPTNAASTEFVQVEIPSGSGNKLIGQILEEAGVIKSGTVFNYYTKFKNYTNFQSGYYNFQKNMSLDDIAELLQQGGTPEPVLPALGKVVIPEGYTIKQIAKAVTLNGATEDATDTTPFTEEAFLSLVQDPAFIARMVEKYPNLLSSLPDPATVTYQLEGYLFPATYSYYEGSTLEEMVEEMVAAMDANLAPYYATISSRGQTVNDVLTLASLVEKEGSTDDDRKRIASVFYNRLGIDMPLQSNIAILYAMDKLGEKTTLLEDATIDTEIDSPYNIYKNPGLMPGPVDNPGLSALTATLEPEETDYLYFVADVTTGIVYYAETFEEHNANVEQYVNSKL